MTGDTRLGVGLWFMENHTNIGPAERSVTLSLDIRRRHMLVLGATGSGKTSLLLNLFAQDAARGDGILYIDPLGDDAEHALGLIPAHRVNQVCYFNVADRDHPVALNVLEDVAPRERELVADHVVTAMRALWPDMWGPRMEQILRHGLLALIEEPNASLLLLPRLLTDDAYRRRVVGHCSNPLTRAFFERRFDQWRDTFREEAIDPVLNKVETFLFSPIILSQVARFRFLTATQIARLVPGSDQRIGTPTEARLQNMIRALRKVVPGGSNLFLFSTPERLAAAGALGRAWISGKGEITAVP